MASQNPNRTPMYPEVIQSYPEHNRSSSSQSSLYPQIDMTDLVDNLFPENYQNTPNPTHNSPSAPLESVEEIILTVPGAILHLIDKHYSVELATGDLSIVRLRQGDTVVAVVAVVAGEIQWPLAKDAAAVKLDESHYFFSLRAPKDVGSDSSDDEEEKRVPQSSIDSDDLLNYGLTIASKGQEGLLKELDKVLETYSSFSVQKVAEVLDGTVAREVSPDDLKSEKKRKVIEKQSAAYWTTLAPNVEDYSGMAAKLIAAGSGQLIKGILWCGDVTVERLKWGNEVLKKRVKPGSNSEISAETLKRIKRVKRVTKMTEKVVVGVLSGVVKVSGFFTSSVANSKVGKKFFGLLPGEIVLASLDGFSKVCDAVEVAGKNVMSTSSSVTTGLVSHKYGESAAKATSEGLDAAGHAVGTAWAVFKIRKALNPKSVIKPSTLAKSAAKTAAAEMKAKKSK
ncbi:protein EARLY-RESPONSIVE TO DEHYDRATION 7, chloroplastic-like isoform X1 [Actinidia eriantha]|uniref:protein EARLY-RESPONSIVE TO DEHYDRATION 7, chloroplastic-like isoform X1 n=1 Tax=Actinidia eriantha TaxID=165200 RepID=UPI00258FF6DE|nr:protein EARLY-RESPONSIVE TO DEHYDRATION 7, chloroplastic-like isoform X1 [Actinidia eriantha]